MTIPSTASLKHNKKQPLQNVSFEFRHLSEKGISLLLGETPELHKEGK